MQHKISVRPACYGKFAIVAYEHIKTVGVEYLELDPPNNTQFLKDMMQDEETQFKVGSFVFDILTDDPTVIDRFKKTCEAVSDIDYIYFFSSTKTKGDFKKKREEGYKILHQLGDIAESYGKFISMETHPPFCLNAEEMKRTMVGVNHPAVRINFDTANIYYYNKLKIGQGIDQMNQVLDHIGSFHLKETDGKYKGWFFPPLGTPKGIVDFKKVFEIMDARGFDGVYTLEIEGTTKDEDKNLTMEIAKKRIENSIAYLKKLGIE